METSKTESKKRLTGGSKELEREATDCFTGETVFDERSTTHEHCFSQDIQE
jgi:hypothetical protein